MNSYTVTVESTETLDTRIIQGKTSRSAQECHKSVLWDLGMDEEIVSIFDQDNGKMVYQKNRGFMEN